jgi:hypothetical protein
MYSAHKKGTHSMSSSGKRERTIKQERHTGHIMTSQEWLDAHGNMPPAKLVITDAGKQLTVSESHRKSRDGTYRAGGPFFTSRVTDIFMPGYMMSDYNAAQGKFYSGPVCGLAPTEAEMKALGYLNIPRNFGSSNESQMNSDGTTAISRCSPTNPASDLGTSLAEAVREGIPTLPGIQAWKAKTEVLKNLGSEYLNYQFGWAPLQNEVNSVVNAARNHRELLSQYHRGEGSDTHREFYFPSNSTHISGSVTKPGLWSGVPWERTGFGGTRQVSVVRETKKWFEGVFTYALPSSTDSWKRALGFGSDADALYGLALSPSVLWELTPWSWAVDWFSNVGDVITNVTNFGLAGLVMRYGFQMEESIERITAEGRCPDTNQGTYVNVTGHNPSWDLKHISSGNYKVGTESVTKRRAPASPFGFSIGWEGLSPTQLAITAALGITRVL